MLTSPYPPIAELVPHAGRMRLIDRVLNVTETTLCAELTPTSDPLFCLDGKVGAWVGIEYMAQAVAAWAGCQARRRGQPPRIGFLLGTRCYETHVSHFLPGQLLTVDIELQFKAENGLGQFACRIHEQGRCIASAQLKVFEPQDENHPSETIDD